MTQVKSKKGGLIKLEEIKGSQLIEVDKWKEAQKKIVEDNPFVEITNTATYDQAKKHRTNLKKGRTALLGRNGQEGVIRENVKRLLDATVETLNDLAEITEPFYEKQQEEVKRYEEVIEQKRVERLRIQEEERIKEEKRIQDINDKIDLVEKQNKSVINGMVYGTINETNETLTALKDADVEEFEEFEITYYKMIERLMEYFDERKIQLDNIEANRAEHERLALERRKFEEEKAKAEAEQAKIDAANQKKAKELQDQADAIAKAEAERKAKEEKAKAEAEAKLKKEKEAKEKIARDKEEAKRLKLLKPDKEKAQAIIDSLKFEELEGIKSAPVQQLVRSFASEVKELINDYTDALNKL